MPDVTTRHLALVRENFDLRTSLAEQIREVASAATTENRQLTEDESTRIDEFRAQLNAADERIVAQLEMEEQRQRITDGIGAMLGNVIDRDSGEVVDRRSVGERFVGADGFRDYIGAGGGRGDFRVEYSGIGLRALTSLDANSKPVAGVSRIDRIGTDVLDRRVFLSDLLPVINVSTGSVEYVQDTTTSGSYDAAEQTEGSAKQERTMVPVVTTESTATVAVFTQLTRQVYDDWGQIPGYLDGRLRYGLKRRVDGQVIAGNGTAPNLKGLSGRTGIATYAAAVVEEAVVSIRKAITVGQQNDAVYEFVVLNPADAEKFDLLNVASAGLHSTPDTTSSLPTTAWGLTRVTSNAVASGTALLVDPMATSILDRQQPAAYLTDSHASNFTSNILTLLLEARLGLALFDPKGVCKITFKYS